MEDWGHIAWCSAFEFGMCFILQDKVGKYTRLPWMKSSVRMGYLESCDENGSMTESRFPGKSCHGRWESGWLCWVFVILCLVAKGSHWRVWQRKWVSSAICSRRLNSEGDELRRIQHIGSHSIGNTFLGTGDLNCLPGYSSSQFGGRQVTVGQVTV